MPIDRLRWLVIAALPLATACEHDFAGTGIPLSKFGDANRQTMMAQVVDPDPEYDRLNPPTSGLHAGQAGERYRTDKVKKPERVKSTASIGGGS